MSIHLSRPFPGNLEEIQASYGLVIAAVAASGRSHQRRVAGLLIAAVAHANGLDLYTRNPNDFVGLETLITIVTV